MFPRFFLLMLCINVGLAGFSDTLGINLCDATNSTSCFSEYPNLYNSTNPNDPNSAVGNMTNPVNSTNGQNFLSADSGFGWFTQQAQSLAFWTTLMWNALTAGYIVKILTHIVGFSLPYTWEIGIEGILGFLFMFWMYYQVSGRFGSGANI
jgi:hypothetical protein